MCGSSGFYGLVRLARRRHSNADTRRSQGKKIKQSEKMLRLQLQIKQSLRVEVPARVVEAARVNAAELVMETMRDHLTARGRGKSKRGQDYWRGAGDSVEMRTRGDRCEVAVTQKGVALHYFGADEVRAKNAKYLALPAGKKEAEYARSVSGLVYIDLSSKGFPKLRGMLVTTKEEPAARKYKDKPAGRPVKRPVLRANGKLDVKYWLVEYTQHTADPTVLPPDDKLRQAAEQGAKEALARM